MEPWEVDIEIDAAVAQAFSETEAAAAVEAGRDAIDKEGITKFDFPQFRSTLTGEGFSAAEAQAAWAELRDLGEIPDGNRDDHPKATGAADVDVDDTLILEEDGESSALAAQVLAEPLVEGQLESFVLDSQDARAIVDDLDEAPAVPFYAVRTASGFEVRSLEAAAETYL